MNRMCREKRDTTSINPRLWVAGVAAVLLLFTGLAADHAVARQEKTEKKKSPAATAEEKEQPVRLYPVAVSEWRWGYVDEDGKMVVPATFSDARRFKEGLAAVCPGTSLMGPYGFIDRHGKLVIEARFSSVGDFCEGLATASDENRRAGAIDRKGEWVIKPKFGGLREFSQGVAKFVVMEDGDPTRMGLVDTKGNIVAPATFEYTSYVLPFSEGLAVMKSGGKFGYVDLKGKWVIKPTYDFALGFSDGWAAVQRGGESFYIDRTGKKVLAVDNDGSMAASFVDGLALAVKHRSFGYIDKKGKWVIPPTFGQAWSFSEGLAVATDDGEKGRLDGYIDKKGKWVIKPQFRSARSFHNGRAWAWLPNRKMVLIDPKGKIIWQAP